MAKDVISTDQRVVHGVWWVPIKASEKVPGVLRYGSSDGIRLELSRDPLAIESDNTADRASRWREQSHVILGQSDNGRELFTIIDAVAYSVGREVKLFANRMLEGAHLEDGSASTFSQVSLEIEYLEAWAGGAPMDDLPNNELGLTSKILFTFDTKSARYELEMHAWPFFRDRESGTALTCTVLSQFMSPVPLQGIMEELDKLLSLFMIFMGARTYPREVHVRSDVLDAESIQLILTWKPDADRSISPHDMLVPFYNLTENSSQVFSKWFADWPSIRQSVAMFLSGCFTPELCAVLGRVCWQNRNEPFGDPKNIEVKQKFCEDCSFADQPQGGHPNGYRQK